MRGIIKPGIRLLLFLIFLMLLTGLTTAVNEPFSEQSSVSNQVVIFSGAIPAGDGNVSIRATSGTIYQIPALTPLGIIQALAGTGMIENYKISDSLIPSRGIFTLDAVDSYEVNGNLGWFVQVNGNGLREFLLPAREGLNTYILKNGDVVIFGYGDPTISVSQAKAIIQVQIGDYMFNQPTVSEPVVTSPAPISEPVVNVSTTVEPVTTLTTEPTTEPVVNVSAAMDSVATHEPTPEPTQETVVATQEPTPVPTPEPTPEPTQETVVATQEPTPEPTPEPTQETVVATQEPTPEPTQETVVATPEPTPEPVEEPTINSTEQNTTKIIIETPEPTPTKDPEEEKVIFDGKSYLQKGTVNVTAKSGASYSIPADSPLGVLNHLYTEGKLRVLSITDQGMRKGGILVIDGINDKFFSGSETWFTEVNGVLLQEYFKPETEGLNIYILQPGDIMTLYYGDPAEPVNLAKSVIQIELEN